MRKRHYGWAIFGLTFANLTVEGGAKSIVPVLFVALRDSFGRSATATAALFSDYLGREVVYTVGLGMQIAAILIVLILGNGHSLWPLILFVALSGLSDGIAGLVVGAKAADLFPPATLGSVMGLVQMGRGVGIMVGPVVGGVLFDLRGDYLVAFSLAVVLAIGCMWMAKWTAGNPLRLRSSR